MSNEDSEKTLSDHFDEALKSYESICNCSEPTNSPEIQYRVKKCMNLLEDTTRLVSETGMFSSNESISEIATSHIKFLLLPALLGSLALKLTTSGDRTEIVQTAEVYFRDFLQRCKDYGLTDIQLPPALDEDETVAEKPTAGPCPGIDFIGMAQRRQTKIQQYHQQKELEAKLSMLKEEMSRNVDEEIKREYFISLVKSYVHKSFEDLECVMSEKEMLVKMAAMRSKAKNEGLPEVRNNVKTRPLVPIIITKNEIQKQVFGAGYPSLPTFTVQELYEQRIKDGVWSNPAETSARSLQGLCDPNAHLTKEREEMEEEKAIEEDDPETLARARMMDEFKDEVKRGSGNRYNRS
nr:PREDICTED: immunoglobulin-binding protein 1b [Bemisia tabaci]